MFSRFFYTLKGKGVPVSPTSYLRLQRALALGCVMSLADLYTTARSILVKSERYFDIYDEVFAHCFRGMELSADDVGELELSDLVKAMLEEWLLKPEDLAELLEINEEDLKKLTREELVRYFLEKLREQREAHHGGNKWIGTMGTSPVGHSGHHPEGMRVGGTSRNKSAIAVANERRYKDYSQGGMLTAAQIGEALKRLRRMIPTGPQDEINIDKTIYETMRNAGEIEIVFDRRLLNRLKVVLMIDNGGWSMDPYVEVVQALFNNARDHFKDLKIYYFHNTVYAQVWEDPQRYVKPRNVLEFSRDDPETRLIFVGDASMAPYELEHNNGSLYLEQSTPSIERLNFLAKTFRHAAWLNPQAEIEWGYTHTVGVIRDVFPMFELSLDGLEKTVTHLLKRY
jgi:uncharacterized protein